MAKSRTSSRIPESVKDKPPRAGVQSVDRALRILETLGEDAEGYRLADLTVRTALSASTAHRLLTTMERRGFVQYDQLNARWHVGRRMFAIGAVFARQPSFVAAAMPLLRRLRDETKETANLGIAESGEIVVLAQVESREIVRAVSAVGGRSPMTSDALGKALLASYPADEVARIIQARGMRRATPTTITRAGALNKELDGVRACGYAVDRGELFSELWCVAAAIHDGHGDGLAAISISGLASRMNEARIKKVGPLVRDAAAEITALIGGTVPRPGKA